MEKDSICILVRQLVRPFGLLKLKQRMRCDYYIFNLYKRDVIEEDLLMALLRKSIASASLRYWIPDILCYVEGSSINDRIFNFCLKYPGKFRLTLLSQMAHMALTEKQLLTLNDILSTPEAFCQLLVMYANNNQVSADEFGEFLGKNRRFLQEVDCGAVLRNCNIDLISTKKCILEKLT